MSNLTNLRKTLQKFSKFNDKLSAFGPILKKSKPLRMKGSSFKKLIHYDCSLPKNLTAEEDDIEIPDENEIYLKENLLKLDKAGSDSEKNDEEDDLNIVNINISNLLSSSFVSKNKNKIDYKDKKTDIDIINPDKNDIIFNKNDINKSAGIESTIKKYEKISIPKKDNNKKIIKNTLHKKNKIRKK